MRKTREMYILLHLYTPLIRRIQLYMCKIDFHAQKVGYKGSE
jgi:hypothetical protein